MTRHPYLTVDKAVGGKPGGSRRDSALSWHRVRSTNAVAKWSGTETAASVRVACISSHLSHTILRLIVAYLVYFIANYSKYRAKEE